MRHAPSLASFAAAASLAFSTFASPSVALASDGDADHVLLSTVGLEFDVPAGTGTWVVTPLRRAGVLADAVTHDAADGTQTRMAITLGAGTCDDVLHASVERGSRFVPMQWPGMPGMFEQGQLAANHLLTVCMDTNRGPLTITTGAINNTAHETAARIHTAVNEHGQFIGAVYLAAREAFGTAGIDPVPSPRPTAASAAPLPVASNYGYTRVAISGYGYTPVAPPTSGVGFYTTTVGYSPSSQQVLYAIPSAYLPNTQARVAAIHQRPEPTMPFGFGAGLSLGVGFGLGGSRGIPGARAVVSIGGRAPSAFEFGVRTVLQYGWDDSHETGEIGAAAYAAIHPLAIARHYRFDPSLYVAAGFSGIAGMGRRVMLPFTGAGTTTAGIAIDVRARRGFHVGAYAEFEMMIPTITSGIWANEAGAFYRASAGIRIMGWGMR